MLDKTVIQDPVYHTSTRTRFHVPSRLFRNNARLFNVGVTSPTVDATYNMINGAKALIDSMYLRHKGQIIDQYERQHVMSSISCLLRTNEKLEDLDRFTTLNRLGFYQDYSDANLKTKWSNDIVHSAQEITDVEATTAKSLLLLSDFLSLFKYNSYLVANQMDLELEINWRPIGDCIVDRAGGAVAGAVLRPQLVLDEVLSPDEVTQANKTFSGYQLRQWQNERYVIPEMNPLPTQASQEPVQQLKWRLNNFHDKFVEKLVMTKGGDALKISNGDYSAAMNKEQLQVYNNGRELFPDGGIKTPSQMIQMNEDVMGDELCLYGDKYYEPPNYTDVYEDDYAKELGNGGNSWFSVQTNSLGDALDIEYLRTGYFVDGTASNTFDANTQINFDVFGLVRMSCVRDNASDNGWKVVYVN